MQFLGESLRQPDGSIVKASETVGTKSVLGLYFSAHWCPPCRAFTPVLCERYPQMKAAGLDFELVFVSGDHTFDEFCEYHATMLFPAALPALPSTYSRLCKRLGVWSIPCLVFVDTESGSVITRKGRNYISQPTFIEKFPYRSSSSDWRTQMCGLVSLQAAIQSQLHPGSWVCGVRNMHSEVEEWAFDSCSADEAMRVLQDSLSADKKFDLARRTNNELVVNVITPYRRMHQLKFLFSDTAAGSECRVEGCATGVVPLVVPLAPLLNVVFCWMPFGDSGGIQNAFAELRRELAHNGKQVTSRIVRASLSRPKTSSSEETKQELLVDEQTSPPLR